MPSNNSRFRISLVQLIASALAAVTAAIAGSFLGVNGTVIGAAIASVLSVLGTAIYSHSLHRTGDRVRSKVPASARWLPEPAQTLPLPAPVGPAGVPRQQLPPSGAWQHPRPAAPRRLDPVARVAAAAVIVFAAALGLLTGVEVVAGRPVSDLLHGTSASGTTVFGAQVRTSAPAAPTAPVPAVTVSVVPSVVVTTPTVTQTAPPVTVTPTPTTTPSGSGTPTNSPTPTNTPVP